MPYVELWDGGLAEDALVAIARRQRGNLTVDQLRQRGLGKSAIAYRCRQQRLSLAAHCRPRAWTARPHTFSGQ
jgi:hypothetical protein